jgi:hypothetical protein
MANLTNISKNATSLTNVAIGTTGIPGGAVFFAWMFLFTIPGALGTALTNISKNATALNNISKH